MTPQTCENRESANDKGFHPRQHGALDSIDREPHVVLDSVGVAIDLGTEEQLGHDLEREPHHLVVGFDALSFRSAGQVVARD